MGVVSNKIKGKAEFVNYSFDVKIEGKNVCRLLDPMQQNMGSMNTAGPALLQGPLVVKGLQKEKCDEFNEKSKEQNADGGNGWGKSGVVPRDQSAIQKVVDNLFIVLFIRKTNDKCADWINDHHRPKPHSVIDAKTISADNEGAVAEWYWRILIAVAKKRRKPTAEQWSTLKLIDEEMNHGDSLAKFHGIVMVRKDGDPDDGMPLRAAHRRGGLKGLDTGLSYKGKWITGDYDLMDVLFWGEQCKRPGQRMRSFRQIRKELNLGMGWDGIQHGPQSQWVAVSKRKGGHDFSSFSIPDLMVGWLNSRKINPPKVRIAASRTMASVDNKLTVVLPGGATYIEETKEVKGALICAGCRDPEAMSNEDVKKRAEELKKKSAGTG
jgi:hypothetical protein